MNVIFYVMDCLRSDRIGAFDRYGRKLTPNLDKFVTEGIGFRNAYAQSGWTAPSAATIFSSQHPSRTGITRMRDALNPTMPWLPEVLKASGYDTVGFSAVYQVSNARGFDRGFDLFFDAFKDLETMRWCSDRGQDSRGADYCLPLSEDLHRHATRWLDARSEEGCEDPFFMLVWSIDTHEPFRQSSDYNEDVDKRYVGPIDGRGRPFSRVRNQADLRHLIDLYDGSLRYQDEKFGEFLEDLEARDLLDETLIFVAGDHGEMFWEHGLAGHGKYPWEEELKVPLLARCPMLFPQGEVSDSLVQLIDIAPTVLDYLGIPAHPDFRGRSLRPILDGQRDAIHEALVLEVPYPFYSEEHARVVRTDEWKYVEYHPARTKVRVRKFFKELGRVLSVAVRPGMLPILYGHLGRRGTEGALKAAFIDPFEFLSGKTQRKLFHLPSDPGEDVDRFSTDTAVAAKLYRRLEAMDRLAEGSVVRSSEVRDEASEEAKIAAHLAELGYVED